MRDNNDFELHKLRLQHEEDERARVIAESEALLTEASKALILLNSGALVAMLGFFQALVKQPGSPQFKIYGVIAMIGFLLGACAAASSFFARDAASKREFLRKNSTLWKWANRALYGISALGFVAGVSVVIVGIMWALNT